MTEPLAQVLEAVRALSTEEQDELLDRLLAWRREAELCDTPVWISEDELAFVQERLASADCGDTVDARTFLDELRRRG